MVLAVVEGRVEAFGLMALGIVVSLWMSYRTPQRLEADMRKWNSWPSTPGTSIDTRVVEQPMTKSLFRGLHGRLYVRECLVAYSVVGKQSSLWIQVRSGTDLTFIAEDMRKCPSGPFTVHYDPQQPSNAHAFIVNSTGR